MLVGVSFSNYNQEGFNFIYDPTISLIRAHVLMTQP